MNTVIDFVFGKKGKKCIRLSGYQVIRGQGIRATGYQGKNRSQSAEVRGWRIEDGGWRMEDCVKKGEDGVEKLEKEVLELEGFCGKMGKF